MCCAYMYVPYMYWGIVLCNYIGPCLYVEK